MKFREWYVVSGGQSIVGPFYQREHSKKDAIRVIEYSALESLEVENAKLKRKIETMELYSAKYAAKSSQGCGGSMSGKPSACGCGQCE